MGLLAHNNAAVVGLHQGQLLRRGGEGQYHFLDRRGFIIAVSVEVAGHVPGRGNALQGFHHGLSHIPLNARVGHPQGQNHVLAQPPLVLEEVRVAGEQLADDLVVGVLAFRVPQLLVAAQGENVGGLLDLAVAPHDAGLVGKRRRRGVVRVLGTHYFGYEEHGAPRLFPWQRKSK